MSELYLIRGVPGSGKTTLGNTFVDAQVVDRSIAADDWMVDVQDGNYSFDASRLKHCHARCKETAKNLLDAGYNVAVCNTFTRLWEMEDYLAMGHPVTVIRCEGDYGNTHGVPDEVVESMRNRFEDYPT